MTKENYVNKKTFFIIIIFLFIVIAFFEILYVNERQKYEQQKLDLIQLK